MQAACHMADGKGYHRLATQAFRRVLGRKQSKYGEVIAWLDDALHQSIIGNTREARRLNGIAKKGDAIFRGYKF